MEDFVRRMACGDFFSLFGASFCSTSSTNVERCHKSANENIGAVTTPLRKVRNRGKAVRCYHLSVKIYRFSDNLPRCQALSADQLSLITWRDIIFLFWSTHSSSVLALFFGPTPRYVGEAPCYLEENQFAPAAIGSRARESSRQDMRED